MQGVNECLFLGGGVGAYDVPFTFLEVGPLFLRGRYFSDLLATLLSGDLTFGNLFTVFEKTLRISLSTKLAPLTSRPIPDDASMVIYQHLCRLTPVGLSGFPCNIPVLIICI